MYIQKNVDIKADYCQDCKTLHTFCVVGRINFEGKIWSERGNDERPSALTFLVQACDVPEFQGKKPTVLHSSYCRKFLSPTHPIPLLILGTLLYLERGTTDPGIFSGRTDCSVHKLNRHTKTNKQTPSTFISFRSFLFVNEDCFLFGLSFRPHLNHSL